MASEKVLKLVEDVKALSVLELSELVKALEEEFGVSAAAPVAVAAAPAAGAAAPAEEEKTEFDVSPRLCRRFQDQRHQGCPRDNRSWT
jgi:large subunit ribosomal protein L7/L12